MMEHPQAGACEDRSKEVKRPWTAPRLVRLEFSETAAAVAFCIGVDGTYGHTAFTPSGRIC
jgi:hypothetical protein